MQIVALGLFVDSRGLVGVLLKRYGCLDLFEGSVQLWVVR